MKTTTSLFVMVLFFVLIASVSATWCDTDFAKRINVSVNNTGGSALTDYQVYVNLSSNPINETSLRVYNKTSCTLRSHWTENETGGNSYGVWINHSAIAASAWTNDTAIYYDNAAASSTSNGTTTFMLFDDFEYTADPSTKGWTDGAGDAQTSTEQAKCGARSLKLDPAAPADYIYRSMSGTQIIRYFHYDNQTNSDTQELVSISDTRWDLVIGHDRYASLTNYTYQLAGTYYNITSRSVGWHEVEIKYNGTHFDCYWDGIQFIDDGADTLAELFIYSSATFPQTWYFDGLISRKYALNEPSSVLGSEETNPTLALTVTNPVESNSYVSPVTVSGLTSLNANVTYEFDNNGTVFIACNTSKTFSNTSVLTEGSHNVSIIAEEHGNASNNDSKLVNFTIDNDPCGCVNCSDCIARLNDDSCNIIRLDASISNHVGSCINGLTKSDKIFDLQQYTIDGTGTGYGVYINEINNITVKNGTITDFGTGIYTNGNDTTSLTFMDSLTATDGIDYPNDLDVFDDGDRLFVAEYLDNEFTLWDSSDKTNLQYIDNIASKTGAHDIRILDEDPDYAYYAADGGREFGIINMTDENNLVVEDTYAAATDQFYLRVYNISGDIIVFVVDDASSAGIYVYNVTDRTITLLDYVSGSGANYDLSGSWRTMYHSEYKLLFVSAVPDTNVAYGHMNVFNATNLSNLVAIKKYTGANWACINFQIEGNYLYGTVNAEDKVAVGEILSNGSITYLSNYTNSSYLDNTHGIDVEGNTVYAAAWNKGTTHGGITILNAINKSNVTYKTGVYDEHGMNHLHAIEKSGDYIFVGTEAEDLVLVYKYLTSYDSKNNTITNCSISNCTNGVYFNRTDNSSIENCTLNSNSYGVYFDSYSNFNTLTNNTLCSNSVYDIYDGDSNTGDENKCDSPYNYDDTGTTGCTYVCTGTNPTLHIDNAINIKEDWGRDFNSNFSANVTTANASSVWMNFTNAEFSNTSLGNLNLSIDEWVNESHNVNAPVTNVSVTVFLNSSGATNDSDSFYYEVTKRTNTATMDSAATQNVDTSESFYVNATCNEEYSDTFLGAANLLEDGTIIDTDTSVTNYVNFSWSESSAGQYNYTVRFYNLTHYDNATTSAYSNVTVFTAEYEPPNPTTLANSTGNFWVNHTWSAGSGGNITDSFNVSVYPGWYNTTLTTYYNDSGLTPHDWSNITVWAYNNSGNGSLSTGSVSDDVQIPNNVPVLSGLPDNTTDEDVNQTDIFDLDDYFTDVDTDAPTFLVESNNQSAYVSVTINASNNVSYTLASGWNGTASVVINVTDGWGGEDTDTFLIIVNAAPLPGDYTPGDPTTLQNTTGNYWVNYTWNVGGGNATDSYNVSWNLTWYNNTLVTYMNDSVGASNWANITVCAYNSSGTGTLSTGSVSDEVKVADSNGWSYSIFGYYYNATNPIKITIKSYGDRSNIFSRIPAQNDNNITSFKMVVSGT